jgi:hypothetical protein
LKIVYNFGKKEVAMPVVELTIEQLAHTIQRLTEGERETLEIMLNPNLSKELRRRWKRAKAEFDKKETIEEDELFE